MRKFSVLLVVVLAVLAAACSSSDASEQMEGVWEETTNDVYLEFDEDGQFQGGFNLEFRMPFELGDYTFDGETLTMNTASESLNCPDTSVTWTVAFSDEDDQADLTFVEDSCLASERSMDLVLIRQSS